MSSSAASSRSAMNRQKLALQRMRAARTPTKPSGAPKPSSSSQQHAPSLSMKGRVQLLPRIADYRSKGWINELEESDYIQLLSSTRKDSTTETDHVALQVKKALDLARAKNEKTSMKTTASSTSTAAPTNSRSLFRKQVSATGGSELTLQKKLSHRRKSRIGATETLNNDDSTEQQDKKPSIAMESKELSIVEAMFGKEQHTAPTAADKQKDRLARARQRRRTSFSPEAVNKPKAAPLNDKQEVQPSKEKSSLSSVAASRLHSLSSKRSLYNRDRLKLQPNKALDEAPTVSLSESESIDQPNENEDNKSNSMNEKRPTKTLPLLSFDEVPTVNLSHSKSNEQDDKHIVDSGSSQVVDEKVPSTTKPHVTFDEAPMVSLSRSKSVEEQPETLDVDSSTMVDQEIPIEAKSHVSFEKAPTISVSHSESSEQQENDAYDGSSSVIDKKMLPKSMSQVSLGEAPTVSLSRSESNEQENVDTGNKNDDSQHQLPLRERQEEEKAKASNVLQPKVKIVGNQSHHGADSICEPRDLWNRNKVDSEEALKDLFVEMAFFARLGFVQPPSCLHCVYNESIEKSSPDLRCSRYVPWRKNANVPIHPHQLDDNILLVQCHAARSLVQGEGIQSYHWDKMKRRLVHQ